MNSNRTAAGGDYGTTAEGQKDAGTRSTIELIDSPHPLETQSLPHRLAVHVLASCRSTRDLRTLSAWAKYVGVSVSSLKEECRLLGIRPSRARDLGRVFRAVINSSAYGDRLQVPSASRATRRPMQSEQHR